MISTADKRCETLRVGICGAARIARKNITAIQNQVSNTKCVAIASRSIEKAEAFHQNHVLDQWKDTISIIAGEDAYDKLIESEEIDAVYIPLPVMVKKEWIMKALRAKKHVLCEKPVSISASEYEGLLAVAKESGRYLMDGTMFVHNSRTGHMLDYVSREADFGQVTRINSEFTFRGDEDFFANDIRTTKSGDPYGCIGDLGWYCVRFAQLVFRKTGYRTVTRAQTTFWTLNDEGVPIDAQCLVFFNGENAENQNEERVLSFHCSFVHPLHQRVDVVGTKHSLEMIDYVIPREGSSSWCVHGQELTDNDEYSARSINRVEVPSGPVQEVLMWRNFSKHCRAVESRGWQDHDANELSAISVQNQKIVDALMESIAEDGKPISLH